MGCPALCGHCSQPSLRCLVTGNGETLSQVSIFAGLPVEVLGRHTVTLRIIYLRAISLLISTCSAKVMSWHAFQMKLLVNSTIRTGNKCTVPLKKALAGLVSAFEVPVEGVALHWKWWDLVGWAWGIRGQPWIPFPVGQAAPGLPTSAHTTSDYSRLQDYKYLKVHSLSWSLTLSK